MKKYHLLNPLPLLILTLSVVAQFSWFELSPKSQASAYTLPESPKPLKPTKNHFNTQKAILRELTYEHYRRLEINDVLSRKMLDEYLLQLDSQKSLFLAEDIAYLKQFNDQIDDALQKNDLTIGFEIFNLYQKRAYERYKTLLNWLEQEDLKQFDLTEPDTLLIDRSSAQWLKTKKALKTLWRKQLKHQVLALKLAEKPEAELLTTLKNRYQNQLNRLSKNDSDDAFQAYINAIMQPFDPHTQYFDPRSSANFDINMSLSLEGIGAVLKTDAEHTKVVRLVTAGPADKSQLIFPADRIVAVGQGKQGDLVNVIGWRIDEVVDLIRGPKGTYVRLEIIPAKNKASESTEVIAIKREKVKLEEQAAKSDILELEQAPLTSYNAHKTSTKAKTDTQTHPRLAKVGVIELPTFYIDFKALRKKDPNYRSSTRDVTQLLKTLIKAQVEGIVIDLRGNGGGSLQEANQLLGLFIEKGPTVQIRDDRGRIEILRDKDKTLLYDGPLVVMVDRLSASASEIFAGAIQDYQRGLLVGTQTFGKGTVQALRPLDYGQLKITQAKFYRISGGSNQHRGIMPDIVFPSLYDPEDIGESTNQHALPWDTVQPVRHKRYGNHKPIIRSLQQRHQDRIAKDPEFKFLISQIKLNQELQQMTSVTLQEQKRREEKDLLNKKRLTLENNRRKALGEPMLTRLDADNDATDELEQASTNLGDSSKTPDAALLEAARILLDYIQITDQQHVAVQMQ